jgi:N-acetylglucosaminyl-diphospho-decaprenol L-rhamnosyltransferase
VVSWNTRELLAHSLESLRSDAEAGRAEVWVVDNGSSDGSPALVRDEFAWARLLEPGENLGFGRAVNRVAAATATPWIAAANADVALRPGALDALLSAGGARLILPDGSTQPSVQPFPTLGNALLSHARLARVFPPAARRLRLPGHWDPDRSAAADWVTGAFMLLRRAAWEEIGGFDEQQWMYAEDLDLCWRARRAGWTVRYVAGGLARHEHGAAAGQAFGADVDRRWLTATYAWVARRRGLAVAWLLAVVNMLEATARWSISAVLSRRRPARWQARRDEARVQIGLHAQGLRGAGALARAR